MKLCIMSIKKHINRINQAVAILQQPFLYVENPQLDWGFSKAFSFESLTKKLLLIRYNCGPPTAKNYQKEVVK